MAHKLWKPTVKKSMLVICLQLFFLRVVFVSLKWKLIVKWSYSSKLLHFSSFFNANLVTSYISKKSVHLIFTKIVVGRDHR